jgi:hypothetical protein
VLWLYFFFFPALFSLSLCREKELRVRSAVCSNCRVSVDNRGWFGGDGFHLGEFYEQLLKLALLVRLGQADMRHGLIFAQR